MRIRSTKPEFWESERIASVSWSARLVLKGLESYVDDNGVGKDDLALIVSKLFSRDLVREPSRTLANVSEAISELHQAGLLWRYEADGNSLLYVAFWESIQRVDKPLKGRFPRPDGTLNYGESDIREASRDVATVREPSRLEQGNRGTGEQGNRPRANGTGTRIPDDFTPDASMREWAAKEAPHVDVDRETANFVDYWATKSGKDATKLDWRRTWQKWMRRASDDTPAWKRQQSPTVRRERSIVSERDMRPFEGDPDNAQEWSAWQRSERQRIWRERGEIA